MQQSATEAALWLGDRIDGSWRTRYEQVQVQLNEQRAQQRELEHLRRENAWYRAVLALKNEHRDMQFVEAQIVAVDTADRYGSFTVNVGTLNGITTGMPVLTADGVVGVTHTVGLNWVQVRTLYHPDLALSVRVNRTGEVGQTDGGNYENGIVTISLLPRYGEAQAGDMLVTSGLGGVFPRALPVGQLTDVIHSQDGLSDIGTMTVFATMPAERVMVVTDFADKLNEKGH